MSETSHSHLSLWRRLKAETIAMFGIPIISLLGRTFRWSVEGLDHLDSILLGERQPVFTFWHGRIFSSTYYWRNRGIVVMTSENFDGEWIARMIRHFGYSTARGSTTRGGKRALVQLKRDLINGKPVALTVDGPKGPVGSVKAGAIWLARATGHPILPFHIEADRYWTTNSWDRTQIPKPFSRVALAIGEPIRVPASADQSLFEEKRLELEAVLHGLSDRSCQMLEELR